MIDYLARSRLAEAARALAIGRITNDQFEGRIPQSSDAAVWEIYHGGLWHLYSDLSEHHLKGSHRLSANQRRFVARCILFLKSGLEYTWPKTSCLKSLGWSVLGVISVGLIPWALKLNESASKYWPFQSAAQMEQALKNPVYLNGV